MSTPVLSTVAELLSTVAALPPAAREVARSRVEDALGGDAVRARAELGLLALELAPAVVADRLDEVGVRLDLDTGGVELTLDAPRSARAGRTAVPAAEVHRGPHARPTVPVALTA